MSGPDPSVSPGLNGLFVVSNREPYVHTGPETISRPAGGLTAALDATMRSTGGTWIAWGSGDADFTATPDGRLAVPPGESRYHLQRLQLDESDLDGYYYGYSNRLLWPLAHRFVSRVTAPPGARDAYRRVNEQFAGAVVDNLGTDRQVVWFQDYHLALAPRFVRRRAPGPVHLTHFWHIPWPEPASLARAPGATALLEGLLANDRIGFHLDSYRQDFLDTVGRLCPDATVSGATVEYDGQQTEVYVQPIGVDAAEIRQTVATASPRQLWADMATRYGIGDEETVYVSVDRLDYTKGILKRLDAIETVLRRRPDLHGAVRFVQKGTLTRSAIPAYERYQQRVRDRVAALNHRFGTPEWQPIVYIEDEVDRQAVLGLLAGADVAVVTPVVDGFNLTAIESTLAAAAGGRRGELVLSRFCGAAVHLDGAVTVNPHDTDRFAAALERAVDGHPTKWASLVASAESLPIEEWIAAGIPECVR